MSNTFYITAEASLPRTVRSRIVFLPGVPVWGSEKGHGRTLVQSSGSEFRERIWPNPGLTGSEFGERKRPNLGSAGSEFRERNGPHPGLEGSELGEKTGLNPGLAGSEFGERNGPNPGLAGSEFGERTWPNPDSEFGFGKRNGPDPGLVGSEFEKEPFFPFFHIFLSYIFLFSFFFHFLSLFFLFFLFFSYSELGTCQGSELRERNWPLSELRTCRTRVIPVLSLTSEPAKPGFYWFFLRNSKLKLGTLGKNTILDHLV